jgi:hypothetical protein
MEASTKVSETAMSPERVTITIRPNTGDDGPISVSDALRQVLDFFDLLTIAQGEGDGEVVSWRLVRISKSSPTMATGEAHATMTGVVPDIVARRGKGRVSDALEMLTAGNPPPDWLEGMALSKMRSLLQRNLNGVGRTDIDYERPNAVPTIIVEKTARAALVAIEKSQLEKRAISEDLSRTEIGSIEGTVAGVGQHHGRPAIDVREALRGETITCVLSDDAARDLRDTHNWGEVWEGRRVIVSGEIVYKKSGALSRMNNARMALIEAGPINYDEIARPGILNGMTPRAYLDAFWGEDDDG